ncbi:MAG: metal ABC transporter ATP-binding protein [Pseudonocardiaceae bacterium]
MTTRTDHSPARIPARPAAPPAVRLSGARLAYGSRVLWDSLDLDIAPGEFLALLGPNGSGKTSLLRVLLGLQPLSAGTVAIRGQPVRRGNRTVGYIPQQRDLDPTLTLRGRDLVGLGLDGHRWGFGLPSARRRARVLEALEAVGARHYADAPVGLLSGGEQQRLRIAQALVGDPDVLLCDEPLLSLDLAHQQVVSELIDARRRTADTAVLFVTHEINPVLPAVDRVLYLVDGRFRIGTPDEVMNSATLSQLYGTDIEVIKVRGRLLVIGTPGDPHQ